jgi:hypothetical protein
LIELAITHDLADEEKGDIIKHAFIGERTEK